MEMPEVRQCKPYSGSPNVQKSPATDPTPDPRPSPVPPTQSSWKRLQVVQWIMLFLLLLATTVEAAENVPVEEASYALDIMMNDAEPDVDPVPIYPPRTKEFPNVEICTNAGPCHSTTEPPINICETTECDELALDVQAKMNLTMDPCNDFYDHTCTGFINENRIDDGMKKVSTLTKISDRLRDEVSALVSSPGIPANEIVPLRLINHLYQLCMDNPQVGQDGINQMLSMVEKLGGWYLLEKDGWAKPEGSWSLVKSVEELRSHNYTNDFFIYCSVGIDWKNASRRIISIDQPTFGISRKNLARGMNDPFVATYYKSMVGSALLLGAEKDRAKQDLRDSLEFEINLANISPSYKKGQNSTTLYNPISVQELQGEYPYINWLDYFAVIFNDTGIVIDKNEVINVKAPSYFKRLGPVLQTFSNRTLANYVMWRVIRFTAPYLNRNEQERMLTKLSAEEEQHRSMMCVDITKTNLPLAVAAQYVRKYVDDDPRRVALDMVKELKIAFVDILNDADWMDQITKNSCLEKVNSLVFHIGYPDELLDDREISLYYRDLIDKLWSEADYLSTVLLIKQFNTMQKFKLLRQSVDRTDWTTLTNQADFIIRYSFIQNSVQIPSGLLQGLMVPSSLPRYMNYGAIGPIIGRWITRACDYQGRMADKNGNPGNWWQTDTENAYLDKRECYIKQYDSYTESYYGIPMDGRTTADGNIADHGGLRVAYKAFKKWAEKNRLEPRLPRLELSLERMFWISAAQVRCSVYGADAMIDLITHSPYSPDQYRVVGPMRNMVEFSEDFNCPSGSPMNATARCKVW